jgi:hypothetical protein
MTLKEYAKYSEGHAIREESKWEHTRLITALIYNSNAKKGKQKTLQEMVPLPRKDKAYADERLKKGREARKQFDKAQAEGKNTLDG